MASRRMFSKRIINSARFLKMPVSTQCLYFHLGLHADDDGVVEAYSVMNAVGASEDDLRVLVAKGFVYVLNDDLVTYISDWQENNKIRADRKVDSIYKDLLLQVIPNVKLIEKRRRTDLKLPNGQPMDNQWTTNGQPMDSIGKDRLGKVRLGKDSIDTLSEDREETKQERTDYNGIINAYNELCPSLPKVKTLSDSRKRAIKSIVKKYGVEQIKEAFKMVEQSDFLTGKKDSSSWNANFDWIMKDSNMAKILDGNYKQQEKKPDNPWMNDERLKGLFK